MRNCCLWKGVTLTVTKTVINQRTSNRGTRKIWGSHFMAGHPGRICSLVCRAQLCPISVFPQGARRGSSTTLSPRWAHSTAHSEFLQGRPQFCVPHSPKNSQGRQHPRGERGYHPSKTPKNHSSSFQCLRVNLWRVTSPGMLPCPQP